MLEEKIRHLKQMVIRLGNKTNLCEERVAIFGGRSIGRYNQNNFYQLNIVRPAERNKCISICKYNIERYKNKYNGLNICQKQFNKLDKEGCFIQSDIYETMQDGDSEHARRVLQKVFNLRR